MNKLNRKCADLTWPRPLEKTSRTRREENSNEDETRHSTDPYENPMEQLQKVRTNTFCEVGLISQFRAGEICLTGSRLILASAQMQKDTEDESNSESLIAFPANFRRSRTKTFNSSFSVNLSICIFESRWKNKKIWNKKKKRVFDRAHASLVVLQYEEEIKKLLFETSQLIFL